MSLEPLGDRVIVSAIEIDQVTASGIVLPDTAQEKPQRGKVVAVGPGRYVDGTRQPLDVEVGDEVLYSKYGGTELVVDGDELLVLNEHDILARYVAAKPAKGKK
jgi:chaperonin GroES